MNYTYCLFTICFLLFFCSCGDDEGDILTSDTIEDTTNAYKIASVIPVDATDVFYLNKEGMSFGSGKSGLLWEGFSPEDKFDFFEVNGHLISEVENGRFSKYVPQTESYDYIQNTYSVKIDDYEVEISDVGVELLTKEGNLSEGDEITWEVDAESPVVAGIVIRQSPITQNGEVVQNPKFEYFLVGTGENRFIIPEGAFDQFSDGDELKVAVAIANIKEVSPGVVLATTALRHSGTFFAIK